MDYTEIDIESRIPGVGDFKIHLPFLKPNITVLEQMVERAKGSKKAIGSSNGVQVIELTRSPGPSVQRAGGRNSKNKKLDVTNLFGSTGLKNKFDTSRAPAVPEEPHTDPKEAKKLQRELKSQRLLAKHLLS